MLALSSLLLAAHAATPADLLATGMEAMGRKDTSAALQAYEACLQLEPDHVGCHWEIGWAHWVDNDWEAVVRHWSKVAQLDPSHPDVRKHLPTAQGHLDSLKTIRAASSGAPGTVRPPLPEGQTLRLRAVGDMMLGTDFPQAGAFLPPDDGAGSFAQVADWLADADLTFGNLEGPLCDGGETHKCGEGGNCYAFRTPTRYGRYFDEAGFDLLSTANNHAEDFGVTCREQTEATLDELGIAHSGRPGDVASVEVDGVKVAMIGFHTSPNSHYVNDHETAAKLVGALDATHDLVMVSFHGGAEGGKALHVPDRMETFYGEKRGHLRKFARVVVEAGADLVVGHGPHVPRGMEVVDGHLVAYSLGNFATYGRFSLGGHLSTSLVLEVVLDHEGRLVRGQILPVRLEGQGVPAPDAEHTAIDLVRSLSSEDFGARAPVIAQDGTFAPPAAE